MQERDIFKVEVWIDGQFYTKFDVDPVGYNPIAIIRDFKNKAAQGLIPSANRIELRKAL